MLLSGILPFTTAPAPIIQFFPILVPGSNDALAPIKLFSPIDIGFTYIAAPPALLTEDPPRMVFVLPLKHSQWSDHVLTALLLLK